MIFYPFNIVIVIEGNTETDDENNPGVVLDEIFINDIEDSAASSFNQSLAMFCSLLSRFVFSVMRRYSL